MWSFPSHHVTSLCVNPATFQVLHIPGSRQACKGHVDQEECQKTIGTPTSTKLTPSAAKGSLAFLRVVPRASACIASCSSWSPLAAPDGCAPACAPFCPYAPPPACGRTQEYSIAAVLAPYIYMRLQQLQQDGSPTSFTHVRTWSMSGCNFSAPSLAHKYRSTAARTERK